MRPIRSCSLLVLTWLLWPCSALGAQNPAELRRDLYQTRDPASRGIAAAKLHETETGKTMLREIVRTERKRIDVLTAVLKSIRSDPHPSFLDPLIALYAAFGDEVVRPLTITALKTLQARSPIVHDRLAAIAADGVQPPVQRRQAIDALGELGAWRQMGRLLEIYKGSERQILGRAILTALEKMTRLDYGADLEAWTTLWQEVEGKSGEVAYATFLDRSAARWRREAKALEAEVRRYIAPRDQTRNLQALTSRLPGIRAYAVANLTAHPCPEGKAAFLQRLSSEQHPTVLAALVKALGQLALPDAGPRLVELAERVRTANNPHPYSTREKSRVYLALARALGQLRHAPGIETVRRLLTWPDAQIELEVACLQALGLIGTPPAFELLKATLRPDQPAERLKATVEALGRFPQASGTLIEALEMGDESVRWYAANSLGRIGPKLSPADRTAAATALAGRVMTAPPRVRNAMVLALGRLSDPLALTPLARLLADDKDVVVRRSACEALAKLAVPGARAPLEKALDDPDATVAGSAWTGLMALTAGDPAILEELAARWFAADRHPGPTLRACQTLLAAVKGDAASAKARRRILQRRIARCHLRQGQDAAARPLYEALLTAQRERPLLLELATLLLRAKPEADRTRGRKLLDEFAAQPADRLDWQAALLAIEHDGQTGPEAALRRLRSLRQRDATFGGQQARADQLETALEARAPKRGNGSKPPGDKGPAR